MYSASACTCFFVDFVIDGIVNSGKKLGRKLGYRTCNIRIKHYVLPKAGIYAVKIMIGNKKKIYSGVAYFGSRPTFGGKKVFLEINIFSTTIIYLVYGATDSFQQSIDKSDNLVDVGDRAAQGERRGQLIARGHPAGHGFTKVGIAFRPHRASQQQSIGDIRFQIEIDADGIAILVNLIAWLEAREDLAAAGLGRVARRAATA